MKKILFLKPDYDFFPVGIAHVITALRRHKIPYDYVDLLLDSEDWKTPIKKGEYLAVATGGLIGEFNSITNLVREVKILSPETPVILGGNITFDASLELLFNHLPIDYAVIGEGEVTLPELLFHINESGDGVSKIDGIAYRNERGTLIVTQPRKRINLKEIDLFPTWDDIDVKHYIGEGIGRYHGFRAMPILTGRGCTGKCTFCSPTNGPFRTRKINAVIEEIKRLNHAYEFDGFAFINEIFYPTKKMIEAFAGVYKRSGVKKTWICLLRADVSEDVLRIMKDAGCIGISFGVESGSNRVLSSLRKGIKVEDVGKFYRSTKRAKIPAFGSFMLGNEGETEEELAMTIDFLIKEEITGPSGLVITYPGTEIYRNVLACGDIKNELEYMKNLDFSQILNLGTFRNVGYLNISAIPDSDFFRVVMEQFRRYSNNTYRRMCSKDIDFESLSSICPVCGKEIDVPLRVTAILVEATCPDCFNVIYFDLYDYERFRPHREALKEVLAEKERVAVYGVGINGRLLQFYDVIGLDPAKICCYVDDGGLWKGRYFFNYEVIKPTELLDIDPDIVLIADTINQSQTKHLLVGFGIDPSNIVPLQPPGWLHFIKNICEKTGTKFSFIFEQALNMALPAIELPFFNLMAEGIAQEIYKQSGSEGVRLAIMPAGSFARTLAQRFQDSEIEVVGFMDNFKWKSENKLDGRPLVRPDETSLLRFDKILLATPSYMAQKEMKSQLMQILGTGNGKDILLFGDLFLKSEVRDR